MAPDVDSHVHEHSKSMSGGGFLDLERRLFFLKTQLPSWVSWLLLRLFALPLRCWGTGRNKILSGEREVLIGHARPNGG
jgi:hypothetical protein